MQKSSIISLDQGLFPKAAASGLKQKSVRGGVITMVTQGLKFILQTGSMMILARLLSPQDFGLQAMVLVMTGFLGLFRDAGLGAATVQRDVVTHEQLSTLFWINVVLGTALTALTAALAPAVVTFYHEPRLFWVVIVSATAFLISSFGSQHAALLQRGMQYATLAKIDLSSLAISSALSVGLAALGCGYWALVGLAVCLPTISTIGSWLAVPWRPGMPRRGAGVRSMLHFGGTITVNGLVVYVAYNAEKFLLGRSWGAEALGIYGRAYQLLNLPLQQLHTAMNTVAFSALSRVQHDPERLCRSFLKGYAVLLSLTIPITMASALFAEEIILIVLGRQWIEAGPILRLLTPTILVLAMIDPFGWFLMATGRTVRSLRMALLIAPVVILGILLGLNHGPKGVAVGYSAAMSLLLVPLITWAIHDTGITAKNFLHTIYKPLLSGILSIACGLIFKLALGDVLTPIPRLIAGLCVIVSLYAWILLFIMGQRELFADLLKSLFQQARPTHEKDASAA